MKLQTALVCTAFAALTAGDLRADERLLRAGFQDPALSNLLRQVPVGGRLSIGGVDLGATRLAAIFELERFEVFAPQARIVVHGEAGDAFLPIPENAYFRGTIAGDPRSSVFLTSLAAGGLRGMAAAGGEYWVMSAEVPGLQTAPSLRVRRIDSQTGLVGRTGGFECDTDRLEDVEGGPPLPELEVTPAAVDKAAAGYTARVAVETDYEFFQKFGDADAAADYVGDLFSFISGIYAAEVDTTLLVSHLSLWSTAGDPWGQTSARCALYEFGRYWNDNRGAITRTTAHFMSGKNTGGGVAWVGVLCSGAFNYPGGASSGCPDLVPDTDNYGGAYGYTGGIDGNFDIDNPGVVWDVLAVSHEIGHNFNTRHTHCYAGVGGNAEPVDECNSGQCGQSGCFCGTPSLPCGQSNAGCGTIMSYCHILPGGFGNVSLSFGLGHPYGVEPDRVPTSMYEHVVSRASAAPSCLAFEEPSMIFADGFESGDTSMWP